MEKHTDEDVDLVAMVLRLLTVALGHGGGNTIAKD